MDENLTPIDRLILSGALEVAGINIETQEVMYTFTSKLQQVDPALHAQYVNYVHKEIMFLWENGFLEMDVMSPNPLVRLTPKALDPEMIKELNESQKINLKEIIRQLTQE